MVTHNDILNVNHKQISENLHTSRVVISRLLNKLENEGKIQFLEIVLK
ncbi:MAG: CRP/FNR family transcriptional regulator [Polaribacter sp.]|jgi:CRP/FNR family transcriptional regulator